MRSLGAFVLLAGIGVGLFVYLPAPVDRSTTLEEARRVSAERSEEMRAARAASDARPVARLASFSPGVVLKGSQRPSSGSSAPAARVETVSNWETNVSGDADASDAEGRYKLVVDIQQELKRAGCYWGRVNGAWNASTRQAMLDFNTRSNAALPVDKPDYMLLSLVKSYSGRSCGAVEATTTASNTPETLPWKAASASEPAASTRLFTPVQSSVVTTTPLPGRMAIGAPLTPAVQEPLVPGNSSAQPTVAALEQNDSTYQAPAATAPKPRTAKKSSRSRRATPGTPRYNLMLSLGGVY